jgi:hypothetical protein
MDEQHPCDPRLTDEELRRIHQAAMRCANGEDEKGGCACLPLILIAIGAYFVTLLFSGGI